MAIKIIKFLAGIIVGITTIIFLISCNSPKSPSLQERAASNCRLAQLQSPGEFVAICIKKFNYSKEAAEAIADAYVEWDAAASQLAAQTPAGVTCTLGHCPSMRIEYIDCSTCATVILTGKLRVAPPPPKGQVELPLVQSK